MGHETVSMGGAPSTKTSDSTQDWTPVKRSLRGRTHFVVAAMAAGLALSACGNAGTGGSGGGTAMGASTTTAAQAGSGLTKTPGVLEVGTDLTYPPYDMLINGQPAGFDIDFVNALSKHMALTPKYDDTRFAQIIAGVKADRYDMIASTLYISTSRSAQVDFAPYFQTGNAIIVKSGVPALATAQDLCGKTVGVITATVIAKLLAGDETNKCQANGKQAISVKEFPTDPDATQALLAGQIGAQMTDAAVAKSAVDKTGGRLTISSTSLIYPVAVGLAVKKGNTKLATAIQTAMDKMKQGGEYDALLKKYNVQAVTPEVLKASLAQG